MHSGQPPDGAAAGVVVHLAGRGPSVEKSTSLTRSHSFASPARTHDTNTKRNRNRFPGWGLLADSSPQPPIFSSLCVLCLVIPCNEIIHEWPYLLSLVNLSFITTLLPIFSSLCVLCLVIPCNETIHEWPYFLSLVNLSFITTSKESKEQKRHTCAATRDGRSKGNKKVV